MLSATAASSTKNDLSERKCVLHNEKTGGSTVSGLLN